VSNANTPAASETARAKALADIRIAGETYAVNYGSDFDTPREALTGLDAEGYSYVGKALALLDGPEHAREVDAAFWQGYRAGSR
jgi:hypothetical protein